MTHTTATPDITTDEEVTTGSMVVDGLKVTVILDGAVGAVDAGDGQVASQFGKAKADSNAAALVEHVAHATARAHLAAQGLRLSDDEREANLHAVLEEFRRTVTPEPYWPRMAMG